jgi:hypothetical protein
MEMMCEILESGVKCGDAFYVGVTVFGLSLFFVLLVGFIVVLAIDGYRRETVKKILYETGHEKAVADLDKATKVWKVFEGYKGSD